MWNPNFSQFENTWQSDTLIPFCVFAIQHNAAQQVPLLARGPQLCFNFAPPEGKKKGLGACAQRELTHADIAGLDAGSRDRSPAQKNFVGQNRIE